MESTYDMRIMLYNFGKEYKWKHRTPEDHIIVELEFCLYLLEQALGQIIERQEISDDYLEAYVDMICEHLSIWVPKFCARIRKNSLFDLYIGTSYLLETFIAREQMNMQALKEILQEEKQA